MPLVFDYRKNKVIKKRGLRPFLLSPYTDMTKYQVIIHYRDPKLAKGMYYYTLPKLQTSDQATTILEIYKGPNIKSIEFIRQ